MIILHAITVDGPLCDRIDNHPVSDIEWGINNDVPKYVPRPDKRVTAELVWKADTHTGDYHDNMNSENFLNWVKNKLVPSFEACYGKNKQMVLVMDNASYHHKRKIGSVASIKKKSFLILSKITTSLILIFH